MTSSMLRRIHLCNNLSKIFYRLRLPLNLFGKKQFPDNSNKIRDLLKVKLYAIRSETKKREQEKKERKIKRETLNIY